LVEVGATPIADMQPMRASRRQFVLNATSAGAT
jgi:hypothetical protein